MKMMEEKEKCFDDCKEQKKSYYEDHCKPRKYYYDDDYEPRKSYYDDDYESRKHHRDDCCDHRKCCKQKKCCDSPLGGKAILKCGRGAVGPLPKIDDGKIFGGTNAIHVGSVTIDTRNLCNPTVLLNFNIILTNLSGEEEDFTLTFTVVKCCKGCTQPVGESFTFADELEKGVSRSFTFQICDCTNCCDDCTTYTLQITSATLEKAGLSVKADISALAVENDCCNSCC